MVENHDVWLEEAEDLFEHLLRDSCSETEYKKEVLRTSNIIKSKKENNQEDVDGKAKKEYQKDNAAKKICIKLKQCEKDILKSAHLIYMHTSEERGVCGGVGVNTA